MKPSAIPATASAAFKLAMSAATALLADISQLANAERTRRRSWPHRHTGFGIAIGCGKALVVAAVVLAGQDDLARTRAPRRAAVRAGRPEWDPYGFLG